MSQANGEPADDDEDDEGLSWDEAMSRSLVGLDRVTEAGRVSMIVAWWHDDPEMILDAGWAVGLVPYFLAGRTAHFNKWDWWPLFDALGHFANRDEFLEELYQIAKAGFEEQLPRGVETKCFSSLLRMMLEEDPEPTDFELN